jgi:Ribosomal protein L22
MSKPKRERSSRTTRPRRCPDAAREPAEAQSGRAADPRPEGSAALADLQFSRKRIAVDVKKCLESAIANAENNHDLESTICRRRGACRQRHRDEAFCTARPWPLGPCL